MPRHDDAVLRRYWKTEPEAKRVRTQTLKLATQHGTSMRG
ncbi:hypothetical protein QFZ24_000227 [Streptomyces phaeochromogenes]|jgi:hypothetical protein|nr:hypothetical protein [Streptomyces phaeochromogenes]